jgi:hypothetical protein
MPGRPEVFYTGVDGVLERFNTVDFGLDIFRLDYLSCVLTVLSTVLLGKRLWQGWVIAGANSIVVCIIGMRTAQFGFVPANLFCIGLYANNLWQWRPKVRRSGNDLLA